MNTAKYFVLAFSLLATRIVEGSRSFALLSSQQIFQKLKEFQTTYPEFVKLTSSQQEYGLGTAGGNSDCPFDSGRGCKNYIVTIQDFTLHPETSESSKRLPEVFLSGTLHGNERVGPTTVTETAEILLKTVSCAKYPRHECRESGQGCYEADKAMAAQCRAELREEYGMTASDLRWLSRLVSTRRIVIMPTTNALGYYRGERTEAGIDVNRDFPYDLQSSRDCMQTIAGRSVNEVFRDHLFQMAITFHGGIELIGYEWGATSWHDDEEYSPDHFAQQDVSYAFSHYAGKGNGGDYYEYCSMNDCLYPVRGGMEDWAYAGSWDTPRNLQCNPRTYGGYSSSKTQYHSGTLRSFNILAEIGSDKTPSSSSLGTTHSLVSNSASPRGGYVARNARMALVSADLVEPYIDIQQVGYEFLTESVKPGMAMTLARCKEARVYPAKLSETNKVMVHWKVGGAFEIDQTTIWYAEWKDLPDGLLDCNSQPSVADVNKYFKKGSIVGNDIGTGQFSKDGSSGSFHGEIGVSSYAGKELVILVSARVDSAWRKTPSNVGPNVAPQSHIVNARTNPNWYYSNAGKIVEGRMDWFSVPITVSVQ